MNAWMDVWIDGWGPWELLSVSTQHTVGARYSVGVKHSCVSR